MTEPKPGPETEGVAETDAQVDLMKELFRIDAAPDARDDARELIFEQLRKTAWDDIGVLEDGGRLMFPQKIYTRSKETGKFTVARECLLRVPRKNETRKARIEAREIAKKEDLDPKLDPAEFEELDRLCCAWVSIRDPKPPYPPLFFDAREMERALDSPVLAFLVGMVARYRRMLDPHISGLSPDDFAAVTAAIVERQDLTPLAVLDDATQERFVITLAALHQVWLTARSSAGSSEQSTPASFESRT